jgi:hypothetical protein
LIDQSEIPVGRVSVFSGTVESTARQTAPANDGVAAIVAEIVDPGCRDNPGWIVAFCSMCHGFFVIRIVIDCPTRLPDRSVRLEDFSMAD